MSWTYDPVAAESGENRDRLRLLIGDTLPSRPLLQDEELDVILTISRTFLEACANACDVIAARASADPDFSHGRISQRRSQIVENYRELARKFRRASSHPELVPMQSGHLMPGMWDFPGTPDLSGDDGR